MKKKIKARVENLSALKMIEPDIICEIAGQWTTPGISIRLKYRIVKTITDNFSPSNVILQLQKKRESSHKAEREDKIPNLFFQSDKKNVSSLNLQLTTYNWIQIISYVITELILTAKTYFRFIDVLSIYRRKMSSISGFFQKFKDS